MRLTAFRRLCLLGALLALSVIVLGAWVRLSHAGLGCPDWPGCYGHLTVGEAVENAAHANAAYPDRPLEADKALKEMVHRYFASTLGLVILAVAILAFRNRRDPVQPVRLPAALMMLVVLQGLDEFVIVDTHDVLLICKKDKEQEIKEYVAEIKRNKGDKYI